MAQATDTFPAEETVKIWNEKQFDLLEKHFAPDVVVYNVGVDETFEGREEFRGWIEGNLAAFPDMAVHLDDIFEGEDFSISRWTVTGTHEGALEAIGLPATGKEVEFEGVTIYTLSDGMVTEAWWYTDMMGLVTQLGVIPEMDLE